MFLEYLKAAGGLIFVMAVWIGVQMWLRRQSGTPKDKDMLDHVVHGCGGCTHSSSCSTPGKHC